ncbi:MAG: hypothetical protein IT472_08865 [Thermomonas sp.]|uniref:phage protease n=1 Tax=Thermomonas sp. TaxID=1971895 RepID=UPI00260C943E|nr:phage protease [Thermomonas sp.]MCC7097276.1 hypothetical protein [Thermomonas sp.]
MPDWIHLLPAGPITTHDGRGPYHVPSMHALIEQSMPSGALRLPIDECHATDKAAPLGLPAPARGWIVALEARADGLWGQVEWTGEGRRLMEDGAYAGISPAVLHSKSGEVRQLLRASLTNTPNLRGLTALHSEEDAMDWKATLIELLGLEGGVDDAAIEAALKTKLAGDAVSTHAVLEHPTVLALQSSVASLTEELEAQRADAKRRQAETFVDGAIAQGRVGVTPLRDDYVALHMENPTRAEALINAMPVVKAGAVIEGDAPAQARDGGALTASQRDVVALMGLNEDDYKATVAAAGAKKETL